MMQLDSIVTQPITKERKLVRTYVNRDKKARRGTEVSGQVGSCPVSGKFNIQLFNHLQMSSL